jgi:hypothetical protein
MAIWVILWSALLPMLPVTSARGEGADECRTLSELTYSDGSRWLPGQRGKLLPEYVNPGDPPPWVPDAVVTIDKVSLGEGQWFGTPSQNSVKDAKFASVSSRVCRVSAVWTSDGLVSLPVFVNGGQLSGFVKTKPVVLATVKPLLEAGVPACVFGRLAAIGGQQIVLVDDQLGYAASCSQSADGLSLSVTNQKVPPTEWLSVLPSLLCPAPGIKRSVTQLNVRVLIVTSWWPQCASLGEGTSPSRPTTSDPRRRGH